ncbi:MAG: cyclophilin-like fold protein [Candidatus Thorarchaeota archaeon]
MTESDVPIEIVFEKGLILTASLDRVLGPLLIEEIKSRLPLEGKTAYLRGEMKITLGISKGNLKPTKVAKRGDIAYMPLGDSLCIYLQDMNTFSPVNILGSVTSSDDILDNIKNVRRGSQVTLRLKD